MVVLVVLVEVVLVALELEFASSFASTTLLSAFKSSGSEGGRAETS